MVIGWKNEYFESCYFEKIDKISGKCGAKYRKEEF
jgi:hypothetical protein